jgi:isopenicillin N synthase-like dioxygenase
MAATTASSPSEHLEPNNNEDERYPTHYRGVKALVDAGIHAVPEIYIRPLEQRPVMLDSHQHEEDQLPMIDLAHLQGDGEGRAAVVEAIGQACQQWGFFQVKNHGVPESAMAEMMRVAREFFLLPTEEKMRYFSTDPKCLMRYATSFDVKEEKILSWRDFLRYPCQPIQEMMPLWPTKPTDFRKVNAQYCTKIGKLTKTLVGVISESLGVSNEYINDLFGDNSQVMGCNFYPACPDPDLALGLVAHSDPWGITILMQDNVGGLQIWHKDHWVNITPIPNTFVINLGDTIQILSNGKYKSAMHRVVANNKKERLSVVTACGPSMDTFISPIPQLLDSSHPPIYNGILYREFIDIKLNNILKNEPTLDFLTHINI